MEYETLQGNCLHKASSLLKYGGHDHVLGRVLVTQYSRNQGVLLEKPRVKIRSLIGM